MTATGSMSALAMKLAPGTPVRFEADRSAPYGVVEGIMDAVQKSEFTTAVAYLTAPKSERAP